MSNKPTVIIEPDSGGGLLAFVDVIGHFSQNEFRLEKSEKVLTEEIIAEHPESASLLHGFQVIEWNVRKGVSPKRIIFYFYYSDSNSSCFIITSTGQFVYTPDMFNMLFVDS